jgi:signal transduction histidine kinase
VVFHLMFVHDRMVAGASAYAISAVDRTLAFKQLIAGTSAEERARLIKAASGPDFRVEIGDNVAEPGERWRHADEVESAIAAHVQATDGASTVNTAVFVTHDGRELRGPSLRIATPLDDGRFLLATASRLGGDDDNRPVFRVAALTTLVVVLVLWGARRSMQHVPRFAAAAEALGRNVASPPLPEHGPREVRKAAAAFNEMALRIRTHMAERMEMLAAVSHDVRTALTKLALRIERADDPEQRERARQDIAQMTALLDDVVVLAREERGEEERQRLDVATLVQALVDDEASLGREATYRGDDHAAIDGRPRALRRALTNLIDNAIRYAGSVEASVTSTADRVSIEVSDRGPGIPSADRARVVKPFERLERSRSQETGGSGLGLAIARAVIANHGGELELLDRAGGGLTVRIALPRSAPTT